MLLYRASLRALGAVALLALGLSLACKGHSKGTVNPAISNSVTLTGTVTYTRIPLAKDASGVPTGLVDSSVPANLQSLPARSVAVRAYQRLDQTLPDNSVVQTWLVYRSAYTDDNGLYTLVVPNDKPIMLEVMSTFDGGSGPVNLVGDPVGIDSALNQADRYRYALRKAADGTAPAGSKTPASIPTANATVNFAVGLTDKWWLVNPSYDHSNGVAHLAAAPVDEVVDLGRSTGTGSRVLAIGDSIRTFVAAYSACTPGATLDLHYAPGVSDARGSFVDYDPTLHPQAYDAYTNSLHYFGSLRGGPVNDDAWDEGILFPMLARNILYRENTIRTFGFSLGVPLRPFTQRLDDSGNPFVDLSPDLARIEGLANAMAANLLHSPYLADTNGTALAAPVMDIRDVSALSASQLSPFSAPAISALSWDLILQANGLSSSSLPATWANINTAAMIRYFAVPAYPATPGYYLEPLNIFSSLARLQEARLAGSTDPIDLAALFPNSVLTSLAAPYGITWPRPTTGPLSLFATSWGADPSATTTFPSGLFTMSKAVLVNGTYPNVSEGEVAFAGFTLSADKTYNVTVVATPPLPATAQFEVSIPTFRAIPLIFPGSGGAQRVVLVGNATTAVYYPIRVRLISPTILQADTTVTVSLVPTT